MKVNSPSSFGTTAVPFRKIKWGRATKKVTPQGTTLYLHVFDWPTDGKLVVPGLLSPIAKAHLLAGGTPVTAKQVGQNVELTLPGGAPDPISSTVVLELKGALNVERIYPSLGADGRLLAELDDVDIHNSLRAHARHEGRGSNLKIGRWNHPQSALSYEFKAPAGTYRVRAQISGKSGGTLNVGLGEVTQKVTLPASPKGEARWVELGSFAAAGDAPARKLTLTPVGKDEKDWPATDLLKLELTAAK